MILQTLTTLFLTLSMGISANTNDFNDEKKSHKNESQTIGINIHEQFEQKSTTYYYEDADYTNYLEKYVITNTESNSIYYNNYLNIANTTYTYRTSSKNTTAYYYNQIAIFQITNYYTAEININIQTSMYTAANTGQTIRNKVEERYKTGYAENVLDLNLTSSVANTLENFIETTTIISTDETQTDNSNTYLSETLYNQTLQANETKTYVFIIVRGNYISPYQSAGPTEFNITGTATIPETPYEVVDIPNLIFTMLSMPFTFISQAFNLTIFPNTPYQINFSNLFMTIIAIFTLIWLIRHIFGK